MSHYRFYGKAPPLVGGFTVNPETQTITVHPKGELPFKYIDLKEMESRDIYGYTFVWHHTSTSDGKEWFLDIPPPVKGMNPIRLRFRGTAYVTGAYSYPPGEEEKATFSSSAGMPEDAFRKRVTWTESA